jgi:hypothetical protein
MAKRNLPSRTGRDHLSQDLIGQYLFGKLPDRTRNRVERHLIECDFCSDAVDGYSIQPNLAATTRSMDELRTRLDHRISRHSFVLPFGFQPYAVAASVILLLTCTFSVWFAIYSFSPDKPPTQSNAPIAQAPVTAEPSMAAKSPQPEPASTEEPVLTDRENQISSSATGKERQEGDAPDALVSGRSKGAGKPAGKTNAPTPDLSTAPGLASRKVIITHDSEEVVASVPAPEGPAGKAVRTIRGMVKDSSDGEPIPGVNIMVKGTQISTTTDTHGNFLLEVPVDTQTLVFSFIGMEQEEMETGPADFVEIKMKPDYRALNEVVVVGYGEAAKEKNSNNPATPEGGLDEFNRYLKENLRAPDTTKQFVVVKLECVVQPDGTLSDFVIRKSAGERYDREAIRVLKEGPRWQPASQQGKPVPKKISLRIPFKP